MDAPGTSPAQKDPAVEAEGKKALLIANHGSVHCGALRAQTQKCSGSEEGDATWQRAEFRDKISILSEV